MVSSPPLTSALRVVVEVRTESYWTRHIGCTQCGRVQPTQSGDLFRLMTGDEQQRLFDNTARAINGARHETVEEHIANCSQADPAYGEGVRKACEALGAL